MIKVQDNKVYNHGEKIGWIEGGKYVYSEDNKKLGFFTKDAVYDAGADRIAHVSGNKVYFDGSSKTSNLDDMIEDIEGDDLPDIGRLAIRLLIGGGIDEN
ncbi:MAG: hypothetical protein V1856_01425 [Candidatus Liptonbacteria bacterium]